MEDIRYASQEQQIIETLDFNKLIVIDNLGFEDFKEAMYHFVDLESGLRLEDFNYDRSGKQIILILPNSLKLFQFFFLIQWFDNYTGNSKINDVFGLAYSKIDLQTSFYAINDRTGTHINSLIGHTNTGDSFSFYLLQDSNNADNLDINNKIELNVTKDLGQLIKEFNIQNLKLNKL